MRHIFAVVALGLALAPDLSARGAEPPTVRIDSPPGNSVVDQRQEISGTVSPSTAKVWLVIRPMETSDFWVQPPVTVDTDGKWAVVVYFGDPGAAHSGKRYEVRAFADPVIPLKEGKSASWPAAAGQSDVLRCTRR